MLNIIMSEFRKLIINVIKSHFYYSFIRCFEIH